MIHFSILIFSLLSLDVGKYLKGFVFGDWDNCDNRFEEALTWAHSLPRDIWWCLETVLIVPLGKGVLLNIAQWTRQPPPQRMIQPKTPGVLKLRLPAFKLGNSMATCVYTPKSSPLRVCESQLATFR